MPIHNPFRDRALLRFCMYVHVRVYIKDLYSAGSELTVVPINSSIPKVAIPLQYNIVVWLFLTTLPSTHAQRVWYKVDSKKAFSGDDTRITNYL